MNHPPFQFASTLSLISDAARAAEAAVEQVLARVKGPVDLAILFVSPHHRAQLEEIQEYLTLTLRPGITIGLAAAGVIGKQKEVEDAPALSLLVGNLPGAHLQPFTSADLDKVWNETPASIGQIFSNPETGEAPNGIVLFADPFSTPMTGVLPTLTAALPGVPIIGGLASAGKQPNQNRLLLNREIHQQGIIGLAVGGRARLDCTVSQGCRPIGKPLIITKSKRNVIFELGGRPAIDVARDLLERLPTADQELLQTNGWLVGRVINEYKQRFGRGDFLIRQVIGIDPHAGYLAIGDPQVRIGQTIQFHVRDQKTAREDFELMLQAQKLHHAGAEEGHTSGALLFSCNGRGSHLFNQPHTDALLVNEALPDIPLTGFFAAGEIGPVGKENFLHGHTASLAVIRAIT